MAKKEFHKREFEETTQLKLWLFKEYLKEWLPVFIARKEPIWRQLNIFDFFAGPGKDSEGNLGSPLIILNEILHGSLGKKTITESLEEKGLNLCIHFNELKEEKYYHLIQNLKEFTPTTNRIEVRTSKKEFKTAFEDSKSIIQSENTANLVYLDQFGVKEITKDVFKILTSSKRTDFMFFISSSFVNRFSKHENFQKYLDTGSIEFEGKSFYHCHNVICDYYRQLLPKNISYFLAPFSLKKGGNIYGIIFGSNHSLGAEKFLKCCWKIDPVRGSANFDIDGENIRPDSPSLFPIFDKPKKEQVFEEAIKAKILSRKLETLHQVYLEGLISGFRPKHINRILRGMIESQKIKIDTKLPLNNIHRIDPNIRINLA